MSGGNWKITGDGEDLYSYDWPFPSEDKPFDPEQPGDGCPYWIFPSEPWGHSTRPIGHDIASADTLSAAKDACRYMLDNGEGECFLITHQPTERTLAHVMRLPDGRVTILSSQGIIEAHPG